MLIKVFFVFFIITFTFQSWTKADDIEEFQIEGMSIRDSLLDYFSKNEIKNSKQVNQYPNDSYILYALSDIMNLK